MVKASAGSSFAISYHRVGDRTFLLDDLLGETPIDITRRRMLQQPTDPMLRRGAEQSVGFLLWLRKTPDMSSAPTNLCLLRESGAIRLTPKPTPKFLTVSKHSCYPITSRTMMLRTTLWSLVLA